MKRMVAYSQILEQLAKHMVYNPETKTIELGVNIEIDGNAQVNELIKMKLFYSGDIENTTSESTSQGKIYILPLQEDEIIGSNHYQYGLLCIMDDINTAIGVGYWDASTKDFEIDAHSDSGDCLYHFSGGKTSTGIISYIYIKYVREGEIPKYYEHQLTLITAEGGNYFINYPSKSNLVIDSLQDLTAVVKPTTNTKIGAGSTCFKYVNGVWQDLNGNLLTAVVDNVQVIN